MGLLSNPRAYLILICLCISISISESTLVRNYYRKTCPKLEQIVQNVVIDKQINQPTTAAGTLRLFFHDCFVEGCDASVLITSNSFNKAERDADVNLNLPGDAFDVIVRSKTAVELACPGVVSCADILAIATRDLITMVGGPYYAVGLGRRDGTVSSAGRVDGHIPLPSMSVSQLISIFRSKGFSVEEMVALSGAHTIGLSHCKEFATRIFNYSGSPPSFDPWMNPRYVQGLRSACENYQMRPTISTFNDIMTPNKFDNMYYRNLARGLGLLASDNALFVDSRTRTFAQLYASNQTAFFDAFVAAIDKLGAVSVKTGRAGEIRRRCDQFNSLNIKS